MAVQTITMIVGLILVVLGFIYYQSIAAEVETMEKKMTDMKQRVDSVFYEIKPQLNRYLEINSKIKENKDNLEQEMKNLEFVAQEIIRLDREVAKLRPVIKLVVPPRKKVKK